MPIQVVANYALDPTGADDCTAGLKKLADYLGGLAAAKKVPPRIVFPSGFYKFEQWPNLPFHRLEMIANGTVWLVHTGEGDAITFDGSANVVSNSMFGASFQNFIIVPGPHTQNSLVLKNFHHGDVRVRVHGAGKDCAAISMAWCVCTTVHPVISSSEIAIDEAAYGIVSRWDVGKLPMGCIGVVLDANPVGSARRTTASKIEQPIIEGLATGIQVRGADLCSVYDGTVENCTTGVDFVGSYRPGNHTLVRVEMETNRHDVRFGSGAHDNAVFWCGNPKVNVENDTGTFQGSMPNNRVFRTTDWLMGTKV
jgi:hypothetical protein